MWLFHKLEILTQNRNIVDSSSNSAQGRLEIDAEKGDCCSHSVVLVADYCSETGMSAENVEMGIYWVVRYWARIACCRVLKSHAWESLRNRDDVRPEKINHCNKVTRGLLVHIRRRIISHHYNIFFATK